MQSFEGGISQSKGCGEKDQATKANRYGGDVGSSLEVQTTLQRHRREFNRGEWQEVTTLLADGKALVAESAAASKM